MVGHDFVAKSVQNQSLSSGPTRFRIATVDNGIIKRKHWVGIVGIGRWRFLDINRDGARVNNLQIAGPYISDVFCPAQFNSNTSARCRNGTTSRMCPFVLAKKLSVLKMGVSSLLLCRPTNMRGER